MDKYILQRPRRLRSSKLIRDLVSETTLKGDQLIQPYFVVPGKGVEEQVNGLDGMVRYSVDTLLRRIEKDLELGLRKSLLFGVPSERDSKATAAVSKNGEIQVSLRELKKNFPDLFVMTDVCLCAYTDHGHCGFLGEGRREGEILNDPSVEHLAKVALSHAEAGADCVSPSDMMDGRIYSIRKLLDENGFDDTLIMSYAVKYASSYYGPFRDAADSSPKSGDRSTYQMDYRNSKEALRELELDVSEGADMVMVKPALAYLDVIKEVSSYSPVPVIAYNVSGEYASVKLLAREGMASESKLAVENLYAMKRAGAQAIDSYHSRDVLEKRWV